MVQAKSAFLKIGLYFPEEFGVSKRAGIFSATCLEGAAVSIRRRRGGAEGKRNKPAAYHIHFRLRQFAGVGTAKDSVLIVHWFLLSSLRASVTQMCLL
ncbi:MAG TPA: hypothetical protein VN679_11715 [Candidatus Acidoferrales bacterium]|nr:hypothetical protein [Candidatus Acidoferrales bacterium]